MTKEEYIQIRHIEKDIDKLNNLLTKFSDESETFKKGLSLILSSGKEDIDYYTYQEGKDLLYSAIDFYRNSLCDDFDSSFN